MIELTPFVNKRITEAIKFKLWEAGFGDNKEVAVLAAAVAGVVKRIVLEEVNGKPDQSASDTR